jgi:ATP-dependent helicase HrpB
VGEVAGQASGARILAAAELQESDVLDLFADRIEVRHEAAFDPDVGAVATTRSRRLDAIRLSSGPDPSPDQGLVERVLMEGVRRYGLALMPWDARAMQLRNRAAFASRIDPAIPPLDDEFLLERLEQWLLPLIAGKRRIGDIPENRLRTALEHLLGYENLKSMDRLAPAEFISPAGGHHPIDYFAEAGPTVEVPPQALFGLKHHPSIAGGRVPLVLAITSPAGRPIQTTTDLPRFWSGSWREVVKEMRGRYPKHPWPVDPAAAEPTLRTKRGR